MMTLGLVVLMVGITVDRVAPGHGAWRIASFACGSIGLALFMLGERKALRR